MDETNATILFFSFMFLTILPDIIVCLGFFILLHLADKKNRGTVIKAKIINMKQEDYRDNSGSIYESRITLNCEFEYNGRKKELPFQIYNSSNPSAFEVGKEIICLYNEKKNLLCSL